MLQVSVAYSLFHLFSWGDNVSNKTTDSLGVADRGVLMKELCPQCKSISI